MTTDWKRFLHVFLAVSIGAVSILLGLILWANPYRNIPFISPQRPLMDLNQRFLYPGVVRDLRFDSAVFGTSSIRLLNPDELDPVLGGRFAQLAMNDATAYEIYRIARLFLETRAAAAQVPNTLLFGIDIRFCSVEQSYQKYTPRPFPEWMYDHDPWNDLLYLFNGKTVEVAARILAYETGLRRKLNYQDNGYANFLPPPERYDLGKARLNLYRQETPLPVVGQVPPYRPSAAERSGWIYASHALLEDLLPRVPPQTRLLFVFVPYHHFHQAAPGTEPAAWWNECRNRITSLAQRHPQAMVIDFMISSPLTRRDENYWDPLHYSVETAQQLSALIGKAVTGASDEAYSILYDGRAGQMAATPR